MRRLALLLALSCAPAAAQSNRVFVSATGNDAASCNDIKTPCLTLQGAVNQVAVGGSVIVLSTGGYGAFTIPKALTIEAPTGVIAFIRPAAGSGITVNAGPSDVVILRGLSVHTNAGTFAGIDFLAGGTLRIERCAIHGFAFGIRNLGPGLLSVSDTTIRTCSTGITVSANTIVERCRLKGGQYGLIANSGSKVTVRDTNVSGNVQVGILLDSHQAGMGALLDVEESLLAHNGVGLESLVYGGALGLVRVSNSTITNNGTGLWANGGALLSRVNNTVEGNTTNTTGTITPYFPK